MSTPLRRAAAPLSDRSQSDKEKKDLQIQLRSTKADLQRKADELADLQEEMSALKEASREREKALKAKIKAVYEEHGRAAVDVGVCFLPSRSTR